MTEQRSNEVIIVDGLQKALGCLVIRANQTAPSPDYPYVSYTVTTPAVTNGGGWGDYGGGVYGKQFNQVWSFTVQSGDCTESQNLAIQAHAWFDRLGTLYLNDNHIVVQRVENISNRDNLLTIEYEYRNGFDVTFTLMGRLDTETEDYIETADVTGELIE